MKMSYRVGVDIGGTFTDFAVLDDAHQLYTLKVFSTPGAPGTEVINGIRGLRDRYGIDPSKISYFTHGSTVGVNSIIQRNGARLCLLTTENFDDVLELARLDVPDPLDMYSLRARPLVSKDRVFQVKERILWDGSIATPLDVDHARKLIQAAVDMKVEGLVIALLHSYRNPVHELKIKELAAQMAPDLLVTCSSEVWPVVREYERTVTAVLNAYVRPKMSRYLTSLQAALSSEGVTVEPQITKSNGGVMRAELGKSNCVDVLLSGTASGVTAASFAARLAGIRNVVSLDVGGTSADVAFIVDAEPRYATGEQIGEFSLLIPSVSVSSIGGGGGSIAWVDDLGVLKSGPVSAGSEPGPACYDRGGTRPTTTDAFAVCGFLGQNELAYGAVKVRRDRAEAAIKPIAESLGLNIREAAQGIIEVAVSGMYAEMTKAFAAHGEEPKSFSLMAFGGAGPMIGCFLARELGIETVLVPLTPGVLSALGGLLSDTKNDFIATVYCNLDDASADVLRASFAKLKTRAEHWLRNDQGHKGAAQVLLSADMRYVGQSFEIEVPLQESWIGASDLSNIAAAFHRQHHRVYSYSDPSAPVQVINTRVVISAANPMPTFPKTSENFHEAIPERSIEVFYDGQSRQAHLFQREKLQPGATIIGPAIVAQADTTACVLDGFHASVDGHYNLIIKRV
jgi:N-methylhydantoinase A